MYAYTYVCTYVFIYLCMYMHTYIYTPTYIRTYMHTMYMEVCVSLNGCCTQVGVDGCVVCILLTEYTPSVVPLKIISIYMYVYTYVHTYILTE